MPYRIRRTFWPLLLVLLASFGCSKKRGPDGDAGVADGAQSTPGGAAYIEKGDLPDMRRHGKLRILTPLRNEDQLLVRRGFPPELEKKLAKHLAGRLGLEPVFVYVERYQDLIPYLLAGKGDLVAASLTATAARRKQVTFSIPLSLVTEQLVTSSDDDKLAKPADLAGRKVTLRKSSSYYDTVMQLKKKVPDLVVELADERLDTEQLLYGVASKRYDVTVADDSLVRSVRLYTSGLKVAFDLTGERPTGWAVRPGATGLRRAVDQFLSDARLSDSSGAGYVEDLPGIEKRKVLRLLTTNTAATYFLWRGKLMGFEYELASEFAKQHGLYLEVIVPPSNADLLPWLKAGRGDLVAAALTVTDARRKQGVAFSRPYLYATETVVCRAGEQGLAGPADLKGRKVYVRKGSSYWQTLEKLKKSGIDFELTPVDEQLNTEEIIARVASGDYDLTVADSHMLEIELCHRDDIRAAFTLGQPLAHGWAVNRQNTKLLTAVNAFFDKEYRGVFYNLTYKKYFSNKRGIRRRLKVRPGHSGRISKYDELFRKFAVRYGFDWRLIAAQAFAESRFDPRARSWVGAKGLMQIMPGTARELGIRNIVKPANGIRAGVKYLARLREKFEPRLDVVDRNSFALASYNAGFGHVLDARRLAGTLGFDSDRWSDNVERAMLLLSHPKYSRKARFGYCRGSEPVDYVRKIFEHYDAFVRAVK